MSTLQVLLRFKVSSLTYQSPKLVSWYFEPSQPQVIILGLKTNFSLSQSHSAHHQTTKFHQSTKSVPTQIHTKQTHKNTKVFEELAHLLLPPLEKHVRLGHEKKITVCMKSSMYTTTKDLT